MLLSAFALGSPVGVVRIESMDTLKRLNISIDRDWSIYRGEKKVMLSLVWELPEFDQSLLNKDVPPHFRIENGGQKEVPSRLGVTLFPDDSGRVEAHFQVAEAEIGQTVLYFDFGREPILVLYLQDFIDYFATEPVTPKKKKGEVHAQDNLE